MTEHTPGPWSISCVRTRESGAPVLQILGADGKVYALVFYSGKTPKDHAASYADARLIAAAPDLLDVLERFSKFPFTHQGAAEGPLAVMLGQARAAIAQARGATATNPENPTKAQR